jgi:hypothetical protein
MPADGDRHTAVIAFLVEDHDRQILIDAGSGYSLGLDTGYVATNLAAAVMTAASAFSVYEANVGCHGVTKDLARKRR